MPEIDGCLFNGDFEGNADDGDPNFVFSDIERRINMRQFDQCDIEVLPGPSAQTSKAFMKDRRFSGDGITASLETGEARLRYGRGPSNLNVSGFDSMDINRREAGGLITISGSSGDDTLIFPNIGVLGRQGIFTGNGHEIIFDSRGVVFDAGSGNDQLFVFEVGNRIAANTSEVELFFQFGFRNDSSREARCVGFEERTLIGNSSSEIFLLMDDGIRVSPDRATVNDGGVVTNAIGFGTYYVTGADRFGRFGSYGNNVVYNNQNDPTLVRQLVGEVFELGNPPRDSCPVFYDFELFTTGRATVAFAYEVDGWPVGNARVVNP